MSFLFRFTSCEVWKSIWQTHPLLSRKVLRPTRHDFCCQVRRLSEVGASFVMLDRLGKVRVVTGPTSPSEARLRRAQALALGNGMAVRIARELISVKLSGQEILVREKLKNVSAANSIAGLQNRLVRADKVDAIRGIESR